MNGSDTVQCNVNLNGGCGKFGAEACESPRTHLSGLEFPRLSLVSTVLLLRWPADCVWLETAQLPSLERSFKGSYTLTRRGWVGWRDGSEAKSSCSSCRGPSFNSQHPCGMAHNPVTPDFWSALTPARICTSPHTDTRFKKIKFKLKI